MEHVTHKRFPMMDDQQKAPQQQGGGQGQDPAQEADRKVQEFLQSTPPPEPRGSAYMGTEEFAQFATTIVVPEHSTVFDEKYFLYLFAKSLVLSLSEKKDIIQRITKLSQYQIDELIKILEEEKQKFDLLEKDHPEQIQKMRAESQRDWELIEMETYKEAAKDAAEDEADAIRKKLGL